MSLGGVAWHNSGGNDPGHTWLFSGWLYIWSGAHRAVLGPGTASSVPASTYNMCIFFLFSFGRETFFKERPAHVHFFLKWIVFLRRKRASSISVPSSPSLSLFWPSSTFPLSTACSTTHAIVPNLKKWFVGLQSTSPPCRWHPLVVDTPLSLTPPPCRWRALDPPPPVDETIFVMFSRFASNTRACRWRISAIFDTPPPCRWRVCPVNDKGGGRYKGWLKFWCLPPPVLYGWNLSVLLFT